MSYKSMITLMKTERKLLEGKVASCDCCGREDTMYFQDTTLNNKLAHMCRECFLTESSDSVDLLKGRTIVVVPSMSKVNRIPFKNEFKKILELRSPLLVKELLYRTPTTARPVRLSKSKELTENSELISDSEPVTVNKGQETVKEPTNDALELVDDIIKYLCDMPISGMNTPIPAPRQCRSCNDSGCRSNMLKPLLSLQSRIKSKIKFANLSEDMEEAQKLTDLKMSIMVDDVNQGLSDLDKLSETNYSEINLEQLTELEESIKSLHVKVNKAKKNLEKNQH